MCDGFLLDGSNSMFIAKNSRAVYSVLFNITIICIRSSHLTYIPSFLGHGSYIAGTHPCSNRGAYYGIVIKSEHCHVNEKFGLKAFNAVVNYDAFSIPLTLTQIFLVLPSSEKENTVGLVEVDSLFRNNFGLVCLFWSARSISFSRYHPYLGGVSYPPPGEEPNGGLATQHGNYLGERLLWFCTKTDNRKINRCKPAFVYFTDLVKAVQLKDVIHLLNSRWIPYNLIKYIENIYRKIRYKLE